MYVCIKLHWWGVNAETCMYADGITLLHLGVVEHSVRRASGVHSQYCKARVPCGRLSTLAPWHSAHAWMRWCLRVAPHASGESTLMWLNTGSSRIYVRTKLHWWGVNAETCMYADDIYIYSSVLVNEMPKSARYHIDRANSMVFTSKRLPLQPVSSERNHQVADKFRKMSCLNVYGRTTFPNCPNNCDN